MDDMAANTKKRMTEEHKAALAAGRTMGRSVKKYLEALETNRPKRGRKRTEQTITARLDAIESALPDADPVKKVSLIQERINLQDELASMEHTVDMAALEEEFAEVAKAYSESKGLSYTAWREAGVPADVLRRAGITRSGR
jgi:hypothetical protein